MKTKYYTTIMIISLLCAAPSLFARGIQENRENHRDQSDDQEISEPEGSMDESQNIQSSIQIREGNTEEFMDKVIPFGKILDIAKTYTGPEKQIRSIDLNDENGNLIYNVEFSDSTLVIMDAGNAKILLTRKELDENEIRDDNEMRDEEEGDED